MREKFSIVINLYLYIQLPSLFVFASIQVPLLPLYTYDIVIFIITFTTSSSVLLPLLRTGNFNVFVFFLVA